MYFTCLEAAVVNYFILKMNTGKKTRVCANACKVRRQSFTCQVSRFKAVKSTQLAEVQTKVHRCLIKFKKSFKESDLVSVTFFSQLIV